jgi:hypothetical protein
MAVGVVHAAECDGIECVAGCRFVQRKSLLEPVDLPVLAAAMRDNSWLDMKLVDGPVPRVRVKAILVLPETETVTLVQEYPKHDQGVDKDGCLLDHREWEVDSEDIMWVMESTFERDDVPGFSERLKLEPVPANSPLPLHAQVALPTIHAEVLKRWPEVRDWDWRDPKTLYEAHTHARHAALWALYELTPLPPVECCKSLGWHSVQPLLTARWKVSGQHAKPGYVEKVQDICKDTWLSIGASLPDMDPRADSIL